MRRPSPQLVLEAVAAWFGITVAELTGLRRARHLDAPRRVFALIMRECGYSYPAIGRLLDRDHSSIVHAVARASDEDREDALQVREALTAPTGYPQLSSQL